MFVFFHLQNAELICLFKYKLVTPSRSNQLIICFSVNGGGCFINSHSEIGRIVYNNFSVGIQLWKNVTFKLFSENMLIHFFRVISSLLVRKINYESTCCSCVEYNQTPSFCCGSKQ